MARRLAPINSAAIGDDLHSPAFVASWPPPPQGDRHELLPASPLALPPAAIALAVGRASRSSPASPARPARRPSSRWCSTGSTRGRRLGSSSPQDKGYFKAEGLDVTIDQGDGSATPIPKVASGTYDVGFGDINALIDFASKRPADAPIAVYVHVQPPPFTRRGEDRQPDQDAEGPRRPARSAARPTTARSSCSRRCRQERQDRLRQGQRSPTWQPNLREQMLMQRPGRWRVRLRQHHPLQRQGDRASTPTRSCASSTTATTAWTSIPTASSSRRSS